MLAIERQTTILHLLSELGIVRVSDLAQKMQVTEETIRRDLEKLESQGLIKKIHGGAIAVKVNEMEQPFSEREISNLDVKNRLARAAMRLIRPGDSIALDASTTVLQLAKIIPNATHLILTYSLSVQMALTNHDEITVFSCGGRLLPHSMSLGGPMAEKFIEQFHVDKVFLSCRGLSIRRGISDANELQSHMKRKLVSIANEAILLVDHSKFDQDGFSIIGDINTVHTVISDGPVSLAYRKWFSENNIDLVEAE